MIKMLFILFTFLTCTTIHAESYSAVSSVKEITVGGGFARVKFENNTGAFESCATRSDFYAFDTTTTTGKNMLTTLISAKMAGAKITIQSIGRHNA